MRDDDVHCHLLARSRIVPPSYRRMYGSDALASTGDRARLQHVAVHLLHQRLDRVEAALPAEAGEEREPQLAVVEIALVIEQERLDEHAAPGHEGRAHADVRGGRPPAPLAVLLDCRAAGVDAVARVDERVLRHEVRGREAERAPTLVAVLDGAAELERRAEEAVGLLEVA